MGVVFTAAPICYLLFNSQAMGQLTDAISANRFAFWATVVGAVLVLLFVYVFLSDRRNNALMISTAIVSSFVVTLGVYFAGFYRVLFIPNPIIQGTLDAGNLSAGLLGFFILYFTGFCLSVAITGKTPLSSVLAIGLGAGTIAVETLLLALAGILYPVYTFGLSLIVLVGLLTASILRVDRRRTASNSLKASILSWIKDPYHLLSIALVSVLSIVVAFESIAYPPTEWDSLAYGLPYAAMIFRAHSIPLISGPSIGIEISANYPPGMQVLAAYFYNLSGGVFDIYYRILIPVLSTSVIATTFLMSTSIFKKSKYGFYAVAALSAFPIFWTFSALTSYVMFTTAEFAIVMLSLILWNVSGKERYLILSGIACGFAALTSYIGFLSFLFPVVALFIKRGPRSLHKVVEVLLSGGFSVVWLVRNFYLLHNPLYPMGGFGLNLVPELIQSTNTQIKSVFPMSSVLISYFLQQGNLTPGPLLAVVTVCAIASGLVLLPGRHDIKNRPWFQIALFGVCSLASFLLIAFLNGFFIRYLTFFLPPSALVFVLLYRACESLNLRLARMILVIALVSGLVVSASLVETSNAIPNEHATSQSQYVEDFYGYDGLAWNWINMHTPMNATIATYDIRTYYINRTVIPLDGYQLKDLYESNLSETDVFGLLHSMNVSYILSVGWASAISSNAPPAYYESSLTKYLGDPGYFPTVYANPDAAVYKVAQQENVTQVSRIASYSMNPLSLEQTFSITITNATIPATGMIYIAVPPDFAGDLLSIAENSSRTVSVELWQGLIPASMTTHWWGNFVDLMRGPQLAKGAALGTINPATAGEAQPGYFTLVVADWSNQYSPMNVTVNVSIMPKALGHG